jgi:hypothetical protein
MALITPKDIIKRLTAIKSKDKIISELRAKLRERESQHIILALRVKKQKAEIMRMNNLLRRAVFRDPKTGRMTAKAPEKE